MLHSNAPIGVDLDDVIIDLATALAKFHNARYGTSYERSDSYTFKLEKMWGCNEEEMRQRVSEFYLSSFHNEALPVFGAVAALTELKKKYPLIMITSRPEHVRKETELWINRYIPNMFDEMYFLGNFLPDGTRIVSKGEMCKKRNVQLFIEDALHNAISVAQEEIPVLLFDTPWNQGELPPHITRVTGWEDALRVMG